MKGGYTTDFDIFESGEIYLPSLRQRIELLPNQQFRDDGMIQDSFVYLQRLMDEYGVVAPVMPEKKPYGFCLHLELDGKDTCITFRSAFVRDAPRAKAYIDASLEGMVMHTFGLFRQLAGVLANYTSVPLSEIPTRKEIAHLAGIAGTYEQIINPYKRMKFLRRLLMPDAEEIIYEAPQVELSSLPDEPIGLDDLDLLIRRLEADFHKDQKETPKEDSLLLVGESEDDEEVFAYHGDLEGEVGLPLVAELPLLRKKIVARIASIARKAKKAKKAKKEPQNLVFEQKPMHAYLEAQPTPERAIDVSEAIGVSEASGDDLEIMIVADGEDFWNRGQK